MVPNNSVFVFIFPLTLSTLSKPSVFPGCSLLYSQDDAALCGLPCHKSQACTHAGHRLGSSRCFQSYDIKQLVMSKSYFCDMIICVCIWSVDFIFQIKKTLISPFIPGKILAPSFFHGEGRNSWSRTFHCLADSGEQHMIPNRVDSIDCQKCMALPKI